MDSYFWERSASLPHWMSLSSLFEEVGGGEPREEDEGEEEKVFLIWSKVFSSFGQKFFPHLVKSFSSFGQKVKKENLRFLAVQNSSISDIVCPLVGPSV